MNRELSHGLPAYRESGLWDWSMGIAGMEKKYRKQTVNLGLGVALGTIIGLAIENLAMGIGIGIALAIALSLAGSSTDDRDKQDSG